MKRSIELHLFSHPSIFLDYTIPKYFNYVPFDSLQLLLNETLCLNSEDPAVFDSFELLYSRFHDALLKQVHTICEQSKADNKNKKEFPCSVISLFEQGCIESGKSHINGGSIYRSVSPHIGGAADVGNSLYAIDRLVFKEKKIPFIELMHILKNNWEGNELLRQYVSNKYIYYGNDCDESDAYTVRVLNDFADIVSMQNGDSPIIFSAGVSTFGRQIE